MQQLSVMVEDDILDAIENRIKASGRTKSDVLRELLVIGLKKPPTSAYRDIVIDAIAEHEKKFHASAERSASSIEKNKKGDKGIQTMISKKTK